MAMRYSKYVAGFIFAVLSAAACTNEPVNKTKHTHQPSQIQSGDVQTSNISITDPYILPPFPGRDVAAGVFTLKNIGGSDRLVSATSPDSTAVEIHNHIEDNGVMRMRRIETVEIAQDSEVSFEPGSYHLMLFGVSFEAEQSAVDVTLNYEKAGAVTLSIPIRQHGDKSGDAAEQAKGSASHYGSDSGHGSGTGSGTGPNSGNASGTGEDADKADTYGSGH